MPDRNILLRELDHRIKNNFQIIVSLINLKKRSMPPGQRADMRFIEEHVQSMSVAYRHVYDTDGIIDVSLSGVIGNVVTGLRHIANLNEDQLRVDLEKNDTAINLDQAIALALYLAVVVPPYLDAAAELPGQAMVSAATIGEECIVSVSGNWTKPVELDFLRNELVEAYAAKLGGVLYEQDVRRQLRFPLHQASAPHSES